MNTQKLARLMGHLVGGWAGVVVVVLHFNLARKAGFCAHSPPVPRLISPKISEILLPKNWHFREFSCVFGRTSFFAGKEKEGQIVPPVSFSCQTLSPSLFLSLSLSLSLSLYLLS